MKIFKTEISSIFKMKDLGEVENFLGLQITRNINLRKMDISQENYIEKLLTRVRCSGQSKNSS